jgi:hypothetical protein
MANLLRRRSGLGRDEPLDLGIQQDHSMSVSDCSRHAMGSRESWSTQALLDRIVFRAAQVIQSCLFLGRSGNLYRLSMIHVGGGPSNPSARCAPLKALRFPIGPGCTSLPPEDASPSPLEITHRLKENPCSSMAHSRQFSQATRAKFMTASRCGESQRSE